MEPFTESATNIPGFGDSVTDGGHNATVQHSHVFNARDVNVLILGFNRVTRRVYQENAGTDVNQLWGVTWLPTKPSNFGYPSISVAGYSSVGDVTQLPIDRAGNTYQITDGLTMVRGGHALKTGFEVRNIQHNGINDLLTRESLSFPGALSGTSISDVLLGYPTFGLQSQANNTQTLRTTAYNAYFQDDWKLRPNFTLNLGLRYEYNTPPTRTDEPHVGVNPQTGTLTQVCQERGPCLGLRADTNNFAPRAGFAWSINPRTVVRGGYGLYYDAGAGGEHGAVLQSSIFHDSRFFPTQTSLLTLQNPFPSNGGLMPPPSLSTINPDASSGSLQHWIFNVQRSAGATGTFTVAYAGSKGTI